MVPNRVLCKVRQKDINTLLKNSLAKAIRIAEFKWHEQSKTGIETYYIHQYSTSTTSISEFNLWFYSQAPSSTSGSVMSQLAVKHHGTKDLDAFKTQTMNRAFREHALKAFNKILIEQF